MNKKSIFIGLSAIILITVATISILLAVRPNKQQATMPKDSVKLSTDGTSDYGACTILNKDLIKSNLGKPAEKLNGPNLVGLSILSNNDRVQVCSYAFKDGGAADNQFNSNDAFTTEIYVHKDQASKDAFVASHNEKGDKVNNIGNSAIFIKRIFSEGNTNYLLIVYKDLKHYTFSINQPVGVELFNESDAKTKLTTIAQSISY